MAGATFKLTLADVPILGSARYHTHSSWARGFNLYAACSPALTTAMNMDVTVPHANYTAAQRTSNHALCLALQHALSEDHWSLIDNEPRGCCNLVRLREVAIASELSHSADLQVALSTLSMGRSEALHPYWARGLKLQSRLNALGIIVQDSTLIMWLLRGLQPSYDHYRSIARLHAEANVNAYSMLAFLQVHEHELQRHGRTSLSPSTPTAGHSSDQRRCFHCGSMGHQLAQCPQRARGQVSGIMSRLECSHCHKPGHLAANCYMLHPHLRVSQPPRPQCSHCHMSGHSADNCFHIIGFPTRDINDRGRQRSRSPAAAARTNRVASLPPPPRVPAREATPFHVQG